LLRRIMCGDAGRPRRFALREIGANDGAVRALDCGRGTARTAKNKCVGGHSAVTSPAYIFSVVIPERRHHDPRGT
jgi:hypothetical protein